MHCTNASATNTMSLAHTTQPDIITVQETKLQKQHPREQTTNPFALTELES